MIEFRGKCGHLIKARDMDAGGIVNCAYCGQPSRVPSVSAQTTPEVLDGPEAAGPVPSESILAETLDDSLMPAVEIPHETLLHKMGKAAEPIRVIWTAIFLIILVSVLVITVRWVTQLVRGGPSSGPAVVAPATPNDMQPESGGGTAPASPIAPGEPLAFRDAFSGLPRDKFGLYVGSAPEGLSIYVQRLPEESEADLLGKNYYKGVTPLMLELRPGTYRVSVVAPLRHPKIAEYADYRDLREAVRLRDRFGVAGYFVDDGSEVSLAEQQGREVLVKTYEVDVSGQMWTPLICLMLPDKPPEEMLRYVPSYAQFRFNTKFAETEFSVLDVPAEKVDSIKRMLSYFGKAVYVDPHTGSTLVFQVWPDGQVVGRETAHETIPPEARP